MPSEPIAEQNNWTIITSKKQFDQLKNNESFAAIVALSRAVNALRFVQMPLMGHEDDNSPAGLRARFNSLLFSCALFVESYLLVQNLNIHFGHMPEFQALSSVTTKSAEARKLFNSTLNPLRNNFVFHFDIGEVAKQIKTMDFFEPTFVTAMGKSNAQVYYELADVCAMKAFSGPVPTDSYVELEAMHQQTTAASDAILEFVTAAEELIVSVLKSYGWWRQEE
jgi:hypothetical protein